MMIRSLKINANAKINLALAVKSKRQDGYHEIELIYQEIDFADHLTLSSDNEIIFSTNSPELQAESDNLCVKAAVLLQDAFNISGIKIFLDKRLPIGGGLGGGSSDAAAVLKGGLQLYELQVPEKDLNMIASEIGADVSFFLTGGTAYGKGKGDILQKIELKPDYYIVLVLPDVNISTVWAYKNLNLTLTRKKADYKFRGFRFQNLDLADFRSEFYNDFEISVFRHYPHLAEIKALLYDRNAIFASLSGSGSVIYGLYPSLATAKIAFKLLESRYRCQIAKPIINGA